MRTVISPWRPAIETHNCYYWIPCPLPIKRFPHLKITRGSGRGFDLSSFLGLPWFISSNPIYLIHIHQVVYYNGFAFHKSIGTSCMLLQIGRTARIAFWFYWKGDNLTCTSKESSVKFQHLLILLSPGTLVVWAYLFHLIFITVSHN